MISKTAIVLLIGLVGMAYQATQLLPPNHNDLFHDQNYDEVSTRIKLSDGRYLAYRETGVTKDKAKHSIIVVHGFGSSKDMNFPASQVLPLIFFCFNFIILILELFICYVELVGLDPILVNFFRGMVGNSFDMLGILCIN
jgi:hypothetical protein